MKQPNTMNEPEPQVGTPQPETAEAWPTLPTETEIYILPSGEVVVADLPAELVTLIAELNLGHQRTASASVEESTVHG